MADVIGKAWHGSQYLSSQFSGDADWRITVNVEVVGVGWCHPGQVVLGGVREQTASQSAALVHRPCFSSIPQVRGLSSRPNFPQRWGCDVSHINPLLPRRFRSQFFITAAGNQTKTPHPIGENYGRGNCHKIFNIKVGSKISLCCLLRSCPWDHMGRPLRPVISFFLYSFCNSQWVG